MIAFTSAAHRIAWRSNGSRHGAGRGAFHGFHAIRASYRGCVRHAAIKAAKQPGKGIRHCGGHSEVISGAGDADIRRKYRPLCVYRQVKSKPRSMIKANQTTEDMGDKQQLANDRATSGNTANGNGAQNHHIPCTSTVTAFVGPKEAGLARNRINSWCSPRGSGPMALHSSAVVLGAAPMEQRRTVTSGMVVGMKSPMASVVSMRLPLGKDTTGSGYS